MSQSMRGPAAGPSLIGVGAVAAAAAVLRASRPVLSGTDPFWHWDMGRRILEQGLIREDPYSFLTADRVWILNQWGTELVIGLARAAGGIWLVAVLTSLLVGAAMLATGVAMWRRSPSLLTLALLVLVVASTVTNWSLRGNLFTFVFLALLLMELRRDGGSRPWLVFVLVAVWANMHAAFLLGVVLVILDVLARVVVSDDRRRALRRGSRHALSALAAGMVTPYGPQLLVNVLELSAGGASGAGVTEWQPTAIIRPSVLPYTILVGVTLVCVALAARSTDLPDVVLVVAGSLFGITAVRNVAAGAIVVGVAGAPYVHRSYMDLCHRPARPFSAAPNGIDRGLFALVCAAGVVLALVAVPRTSSLEPHVRGVPLDAIRELDALDRPARVVTVSRWAAAVGTLTGDHVTISVDGRVELFTSEEYRDLRTVESVDPGWRDVLETWCASDVIAPKESPLATGIQESGDWRVVRTAGRNREDVVALHARRSRMPRTCEPSGGR